MILESPAQLKGHLFRGLWNQLPHTPLDVRREAVQRLRPELLSISPEDQHKCKRFRDLLPTHSTHTEVTPLYLICTKLDTEAAPLQQLIHFSDCHLEIHWSHLLDIASSLPQHKLIMKRITVHSLAAIFITAYNRYTASCCSPDRAIASYSQFADFWTSVFRG